LLTQTQDELTEINVEATQFSASAYRSVLQCCMLEEQTIKFSLDVSADGIGKTCALSRQD